MNKDACLHTPLPTEIIINLLNLCQCPKQNNALLFNLHFFLVKLSIFLCLLTICISSLIVHFLVKFFGGWFIFFLLIMQFSLYILEIIPLSFMFTMFLASLLSFLTLFLFLFTCFAKQKLKIFSY